MKKKLLGWALLFISTSWTIAASVAVFGVASVVSSLIAIAVIVMFYWGLVLVLGDKL